MKRLLPILICALCGCQMMPPLNIESLSKQLSEGNSSFTLNVTGRNVLITRVNPMLGISSSVGTNGTVQTAPPNGFNLSAFHYQHSLAPPGTAAPQQTNNPSKQNP